MTNLVKETKVPSIPEPVGRTATEKSFLQAVKEALEIRLGRRGDDLDRAVTLRDLYENGVVNISVNGTTYTKSGSTGLTSTPYTTGTSFSASSAVDTSTPPTPTSVTTSGGKKTIIVKWAWPKYANHAYTEVWRGTSATFSASTTTKVGVSKGTIYADDVSASAVGTTFYYWVRLVSGADVTGAYYPATSAGASGVTSTSGALSLSSFDFFNMAAVDDLTASSISSNEMNANEIVTAQIQSTNFSSGSAGWELKPNGDFEANSGTFRGTLNVKSSATGARLEISSSTIKVYDSSNVLRVLIGDLS